MHHIQLANSLLTFTGEDGHAYVHGYLFDFKGMGIFSPDSKLKGISKEQMESHNKALEAIELKALAESKIGERGTLYYINGTVQTFLGTKVNEHISLGGSTKRRTIQFTYQNKCFSGMLSKDADCFNFKRIA